MDATQAIEKLKDSSLEVAVRVEAARALAGRKDPEALEALAQVLTVTHEDLRDAATRALKDSGGAVYFASLLGEGKEPARRVLAARALRYLRDPATAPVLGACLGQPDAEVRRECAHALAVFGGEKAREALVQALNDPSSDVRYFAVIALGALPEAQVRSALEARRNVETDPTVRGELDRVLR